MAAGYATRHHRRRRRTNDIALSTTPVPETSCKRCCSKPTSWAVETSAIPTTAGSPENAQLRDVPTLVRIRTSAMPIAQKERAAATPHFTVSGLT